MTKLTQEIVRELLDYDPATGLLTWKPRGPEWFSRSIAESTFKSRCEGKPVTTKFTTGYIKVKILGNTYHAHRVIWLWKTGAFPLNQIDHINRDRSDNRWKNLREVTGTENMRNTGVRKDNTSGIKGVSWVKRTGRWYAHIRVNRKNVYLGYYDDLTEAARARTAAEIRYGFMSATIGEAHA